MKLNYDCPDDTKGGKTGKGACGGKDDPALPSVENRNGKSPAQRIEKYSKEVKIGNKVDPVAAGKIIDHVVGRMKDLPILGDKLDTFQIPNAMRKGSMYVAASYASPTYTGLLLPNTHDQLKKDATFMKGFDREVLKEGRLPTTIGSWALAKGAPGNLGLLEIDHELGHIAWSKLSKEDQKEWSTAYKKNVPPYDPNKLDDAVKSTQFYRNAKEAFCESFSMVINDLDQHIPKPLAELTRKKIGK